MRSPSWQAQSSNLKMLVIDTTDSTFSMGHVAMHARACVCVLVRDTNVYKYSDAVCPLCWPER